MDGIKTIVAVVETGSFTTASERLGMSKALVSKYVAQVEKNLGVRLFNRSTRSLALTQAGKNYYQRALPLLDEYTELVDNVSTEQSSACGLLRVSAPVSFGENELSSVINQFLISYPQIQLDLKLTNRSVDMLEEGIDVKIRIGGVVDSNLIARKINSYPLVLCASPQYLKQHGCPEEAEDLLDHTCIIDSNFKIGKQWPLRSKDAKSAEDKTEIIKVTSRISVNSPTAVREIAISGAGIGLIPEFIVQEAIKERRLTVILPQYTSLEFGLFAIYPHRRYLSKKVKCFIDFLFERFSS